MHDDQPDLDDDDGVPRVDYVDCERDGRLARYAAAVRRTPGNDRHQTRTHVGSSLSQNVSDLPSTAWRGHLIPENLTLVRRGNWIFVMWPKRAEWWQQ